MGKVEEIVKLIKEKFKVDEKQILDEIKQKVYEFSGLITEEGAAMLVAREYGINVTELKTFTNLSELVGGMKNVNVRVKVFKVIPSREFEKKDGSKGYLKVFLVGDHSDFARVVFWDELALEAEEIKIKTGDVLKIYNARTKENIFGEIDIIVNRNTTIEFDKKDDLPSVDELLDKFSKNRYERLSGNLESIGYYEVFGMISAVFGNNFFFKTCPICGNKVGKFDEKYLCDIHGEINPKNSLFLRFELNNFSGNLRVVAFKDVAEKIVGMKIEDLEKIENLKDFLIKTLIGKLLLIRGRARKNRILNILELIANEVEEGNLEKEIELLTKKYGE